MRNQLFSVWRLVCCFLIVISLIPFPAVGSEDRANLSDCDGEQLKDLKSLPENCRHCVPLVVDEIIRCLPYFMPGDIKSAESSPYSDSYSVTLGMDVTLQGFTWPAGTKLMTNMSGGDIGSIRFPKETMVKGFPVLGFALWTFDSIHIKSLELQVAQSYGGYLWPKGSGLNFHYDSKEKPKLWYVRLGEDSIFDGIKFRKGKFIWFDKHGKIDLTAPKPKPLN